MGNSLAGNEPARRKGHFGRPGPRRRLYVRRAAHRNALNPVPTTHVVFPPPAPRGAAGRELGAARASPPPRIGPVLLLLLLWLVSLLTE